MDGRSPISSRSGPERAGQPPAGSIPCRPCRAVGPGGGRTRLRSPRPRTGRSGLQAARAAAPPGRARERAPPQVRIAEVWAETGGARPAAPQRPAAAGAGPKAARRPGAGDPARAERTARCEQPRAPRARTGAAAAPLRAAAPCRTTRRRPLPPARLAPAGAPAPGAAARAWERPGAAPLRRAAAAPPAEVAARAALRRAQTGPEASAAGRRGRFRLFGAFRSRTCGARLRREGDRVGLERRFDACQRRRRPRPARRPSLGRAGRHDAQTRRNRRFRELRGGSTVGRAAGASAGRSGVGSIRSSAASLGGAGRRAPATRTMLVSTTTSFGPPMRRRCSTLSRRSRMSWRWRSRS